MSQKTSQKSTAQTEDLKRVCVLGGGAWGSVIARIIARNVQYFKKFHPKVVMYVFEEYIDGKKLTHIINTEHENPKYAKGFEFTKNLVAIGDPIEASKNADIIVFVTPQQFIYSLCESLCKVIKRTAIGISLIKGFEVNPGEGIELISKVISKKLNIPCYVLMGANIAQEIGEEQIVSSTTIGCNCKATGALLKDLFQTPHFKVTVVPDQQTVEICGALKNIIATGIGFLDGLDQTDRIKETLIRLGFIEMVKFTDAFFPGGNLSTFFESCGMKDIIVTSFAGRNRKCAEAFVRTGKSFFEVEAEILKGQKLQGPPTADVVNVMLRTKNMIKDFPIFTMIHYVCVRREPPEELVKTIKKFAYLHTYLPKTLKSQ